MSNMVLYEYMVLFGLIYKVILIYYIVTILTITEESET